MYPYLFRHWTLFSIAILVAGAAWIAFSRSSPNAITSGATSAPRQGFLAPDFALKEPDGKLVRLSDLRGHPVLVNLWASWCGPCKAEMQNIEKAYQAYHSQGFEVLAVNMTYQDSAEAAISFVRQEGLTFPILYDPSAQASKAYALQALPSSFFVDKKGIIQEVVIGGPMSEALLRTQVERLLGGE